MNSITRHHNVIIFILGMHRSGTSAITRLLNIMGANLGEPLIPPTAGINEKGFWEHAEVVRINEEILKQLDSSWFDHRHLPHRWWELKKLSQVKKQAQELFENTFKNHKLVVIKDPRFCRLLPFWTHALQQPEREVKCILALRHPKEVAKSIHKRDYFDTMFCYFLWLTYLLDSEWHSRPFQRIVIHYEQVLKDWERTVEHISSKFGIIWSNPIDSVKEIVRREILPDLQHQFVNQNTFEQDYTIPKQVKTVYRLFVDKELAEIEGSLDSIRSEWKRSAIMMDPEISDLLFRINCRSVEQAGRVQILAAGQRESLKTIEEKMTSLDSMKRTVGEVNDRYQQLAERLAKLEDSYRIATDKNREKDIQLLWREKRYQQAMDDLYQKDHQIAALEKRQAAALEEIGVKDERLNVMEGLYARLLLRLDELERLEAEVQKSAVAAFFRRKIQSRNRLKIHFHFDEIQFQAGKLTIQGWIFSEIQKIDHMELLIDDYRTERHPVQLDILRADVYEKFKHPNTGKSGFKSSLKTRKRGNVRLYLNVCLEDGSSGCFFVRKMYCTRKKRYLNHFFDLLGQLSSNDFRFAFTLLLNGNFNTLKTAVENRLDKLRSPQRDRETLSVIAGAFTKTPFLPSRDEEQEIDIIVPVYNGMEFLPSFFDDLIKNTRIPYRLIIVDDCSTDTEVFPFLKAIQTSYHQHVILRRNNRNLGFIKSVNIGYQQTKNHFVILNTDVLLPEDWLTRLMAPILQNPLIASTTPFTNSGTICSFPELLNDNPIFESLDIQHLNSFFIYVNPAKIDVTIPTGVGFCMGINQDAAQQIGFFDEISYEKGYGEENDWCMRALKRGFRNIIVPNLFVYHQHGASFPEKEKQALLKRNLKVLLTRYPEYQQMVDEYIAADKLKGIRNFLQLLITSRLKSSGLCAVIDHALGGGANIYRENMIKALLEKERAVLLLTYNYNDQFVLLYQHKNRKIQFHLDSFQEFGVLFDWVRLSEMIVNDLVSFPDPLGVIKTILQWKQIQSFVVRIAVHNYFSICPSYNLLNHEGKFCRSFQTNSCKITFPHNHGDFRMSCHSNDKFDMDEWRDTWRDFLNRSDQVMCFSQCSADILCTVYAEVNGNLNIAPHRVDYLGPVKRHPKHGGEALVIGVLGAINYAKGIEIIREMAKVIQLRKANVKIVVIGITSVDIKSPIVTVTGEYKREQLPDIVIKYSVDIFLIPSIWPETFSYTAEEVIQMNYPLAVFKIGAPVERVAGYKNGLIINEINAISALDQIMDWKKGSLSNG